VVVNDNLPLFVNGESIPFTAEILFDPFDIQNGLHFMCDIVTFGKDGVLTWHLGKSIHHPRYGYNQHHSTLYSSNGYRNNNHIKQQGTKLTAIDSSIKIDWSHVHSHNNRFVNSTYSLSKLQLLDSARNIELHCYLTLHGNQHPIGNVVSVPINILPLNE